jgi:hypothetical protein
MGVLPSSGSWGNCARTPSAVPGKIAKVGMRLHFLRVHACYAARLSSLSATA